MTVEELLSKISSRELTEWMEYAKIEPLSDERNDAMIGVLSALVANALSDKKGKKYKPEDFIPDYGVEKEQTVEEQMKALGVKMPKEKVELLDHKGNPL